MPGLRYPGPTITAPFGNYSFLQDVQTPTVKECSWDRPVDLNHEHLPPAAEAPPFICNQHKAFCPPQFHAERTKGKGGSASNARFSTEVFPTDLSPSSKDGSEYDEELAFVVDDLGERGSSSLRVGSDSDHSGSFRMTRLCNTLQVHRVVLGMLP